MEKLEENRMQRGWPHKRRNRRTHVNIRTEEDLGYRWAGSVKMGQKQRRHL